MRVKNLRSIVITIIGCTLAVSGVLLYVLWPTTAAMPFYGDCRKIWSHRTLADGESENSLQGLRHAFELGAPGVEIDIIYDAKRNGIYVISEEAVSDGRPAVLGLTDMLTAVPQNGFVWLDFWNLKQLHDEDVRQSIRLLKKILNATGMIDRAIIESTNSASLGVAAAQGMYTSLWIQIRPLSVGYFAHLRDLMHAVKQFRSSTFSAVSIDYTEYGNFVRLVFSRVPIYLFTVNDHNIVRELVKDFRVKIILSDSFNLWNLDCRNRAIDLNNSQK